MMVYVIIDRGIRTMAQYKIRIEQTLSLDIVISADCEDRALEIAEEENLYEYTVDRYAIYAKELEQ
jgi:hypothetical protein